MGWISEEKRGSILERDKILISSAKSPDSLWWPPSLLFSGTMDSLSGSKATGVWNETFYSLYISWAVTPPRPHSTLKESFAFSGCEPRFCRLRAFMSCPSVRDRPQSGRLLVKFPTIYHLHLQNKFPQYMTTLLVTTTSTSATLPCCL
jgi:hypothetical protein